MVGISLGTNDFAGGCDADRYQACYANFLETVRTLYPDTHIVCAMGIIDIGCDAVQHIEAAIAESGVGNVSFFKMTVNTVAEAEKWGADGQPSAKSHAEMAAQLSSHIAEQMGR